MVSKFPTVVMLSQTITPKGNEGKRHVVFSANSRIERLKSAKSWRAQLDVTFSSGEVKSIRDEFDMAVPFDQWQNIVMSICIAPYAVVEKIEIFAALETFRGAVYWDDFAVLLM
jgi:hypothetical protein